MSDKLFVVTAGANRLVLVSPFTQILADGTLFQYTGGSFTVADNYSGYIVLGKEAKDISARAGVTGSSIISHLWLAKVWTARGEIRQLLQLQNSPVDFTINPTALAEIIGTSIVFQTIPLLRAGPDYSPFALAVVTGGAAAFDGAGGIYAFNGDSTADDDGVSIVKPDAIDALDPGRWQKLV